MTDTERVKELLATKQDMVLAVTCDDGTPWAVPVHVQLQWGVAFEWDSMIDSLHSKALTEQSDMAITVFEAGDNEIGITATGHGVLVEEKQHGLGRYRFIASAMWLNDATHVKREVKLNELINQIEQ